MKKILFILSFLALCLNVKATNYYWIGNSTAVWGATNSWSTAGFGGAAAGSIPGTSDDVFIGNGSTNVTVTLDANYSIASLTLGGTGQLFINGTGKVLTVSGDITDANTNATGGGSATLGMTGGTATLSCTATSADHGKLPNLTFASGCNVTLSGFITMGGSTVLTNAGTVNSGTSTMVFYYNNTITGNIDFNDVELEGNSGAVVIYNTVNVNGNLKVSGSGSFVINNGNVNVYGNLNYVNTSINSGGNGKIVMAGSGNNTYAFTSGTMCQFAVNKSGGSLSPASGTTQLAVVTFKLDAGTFTAPAGKFNIGIGQTYGASTTLFNQTGGSYRHNNGTLFFNLTTVTPYSFEIDVPDTTWFNNVTIYCHTNGVTSLGTSDTMKMRGNFSDSTGTVTGTYEVQGNLTVGPGALTTFGKIIMSGSHTGTYKCSPTGYTCSLIINKAVGDSVLPATGDTSLNVASLTLLSGIFVAPSKTLFIGIPAAYGNFYPSSTTIFDQATGTTFIHNNGTVRLAPYAYNNINFTVNALSTTLFNNFTIDAGNYIGTSITISATGDTVNVLGKFIMNRGAVSGIWRAYGNITMGSTYVYGGTNQLIVAGLNNQTFNNVPGTSLTKVAINKTGGTFTLNSVMGVVTTLALQKGIITGNGNTVVLLNGATVTGISNNSFVSGAVKKIGNAAFTFPIGKGNYYDPIAISAPSSSTDAFTAEYFNAANDTTAHDTSLTHVGNCKYWHLYRTTGTSNVKVKLYWNSPDTCDIYTLSTLRIAYLNSGTWKNVPSKVLGTTANGRDSSTSTVSSYGTFTIGKKSPLLFAHAGTDKVYCAGGSATIGASPAATGGLTPYSYTWSPTTGLSSSTAAQPMASPTATTTYVLTVTDLDHTIAYDTMIATLSSSVIAHAGRDTNICMGLNTTIGATIAASGGTSPYAYTWSPSSGLNSLTASHPVANPTVTTTYILSITDNNLCSATDTVIVQINKKPSFTYLSSYAVLAGGNIIDTSSNFGHGKIGAHGIISTKIYAKDAVEAGGAGNVNAALTELNNTRTALNHLVPTTIPVDSVDGHTFYCGVYSVSGDLVLTKSLTLIGDSNTMIIFNISGQLKINPQAKILLTGISPSQVIFNVNGKTVVNDSLDINGCFLSKDSIIFWKTTAGKFCAFSDSSVLSYGKNIFYKITDMSSDTSFYFVPPIADSLFNYALSTIDSARIKTDRASILINAFNYNATTVSNIPTYSYVTSAMALFAVVGTEEDSIHNITLKSPFGEVTLTAGKVSSIDSVFLSSNSYTDTTSFVLLRSGTGALTSFYAMPIPPQLFMSTNINGDYTVCGLPVPLNCPGPDCNDAVYTARFSLMLTYYPIQ